VAKSPQSDLTARAAEVIKRLAKVFPDARTALDFRNPLELLVATILSAQCTDVRVNLVTAELFKKYKKAADYAAANPAAFEQEIRSTGFYHNKTRSIIGMAQRLVEHFGGTVPDSMADLLTLPGVARKTANVVLGSAFGKNEGVAVDTHVIRVAGRLGLTRQTDPVKIEQDLMALLPRKDWTRFSHLLIWHGRQTCAARKPKCAQCALNDICPSAFKVG
jgi:endonuclease III